MDDYNVILSDVLESHPKVTSLVNGYAVFAVEKLWHKMEDRKGNMAEQGGMTVTVPYGSETRLAIPYTSNPGELPEDCMTIEQLQDVMKQFISVNKIFIIKEENNG